MGTESTEHPAPARTGIVLSGDTKPLSLVPSSYSDIVSLSTQLARSALIPAVLRDKPGDVAIIIMTGLEFGFSPMVSLRHIYVVEGKPAMSADAQVSVAMRRTDVCEYFYPVEMTADKATFEAKRKGTPNPTRLTYSIADAQRAGLTGKPNWKLNQIGMLANRCKSTLVKAVFADLLLGMPSFDEAADIAQAERDVTPAPARPEVGARVVGLIKHRAEPADAPPHDPVTSEVLGEMPVRAEMEKAALRAPTEAPAERRVVEQDFPTVEDRFLEDITQAADVAALKDVGEEIERARRELGPAAHKRLLAVYQGKYNALTK